jgi:hypothetical protein
MSKIDPLKVATFCEVILSKYIGFKVNIKPETDTRYSLNNPESFDNISIAMSDRGERELKVFPLLCLNQSIKGLFWVYFSITFSKVNLSSKKYEFLFDGVSIAIFRGLKTDVNKEMLFRAEWDCKSDKDNKIHPHPHWHIHFVKEKIPQKAKEDFNAYLNLIHEEEPDFLSNEDKTQELKEFDITKFHFAMGASWQPKRIDKLQLDENSLKSWLNYTLEHIKEQLEYAAS